VTDAGPAYDAGVLVICDRGSVNGANYKLVAWQDLARAAQPNLPIDLPDFSPPPVVPPEPPRLAPSLRRAVPPGSLDLGFWPGRDALAVTLDGVSVLSLVDLSSATVAPDAGARTFTALAAAGDLSGFSSGALVATSATADGGALELWAPSPDGGLTLAASAPVPLSRALAVADVRDAGLVAWLAAGRALSRFELATSDGGVAWVTTKVDGGLSEPVNSLVAWPAGGRLFAGTRLGITQLDLTFGASTATALTGGATALGLYPQRDGGVLLVSATSTGLVRVTRPGSALSLLEFYVALDGGLAPGWLDVSREPVGALPDGGFRFPSGAIALAATSQDAGVLALLDWALVARAASPALPIDSASAPPLAGGTAGGAAAGGSSGGGVSGTGGGRSAGGSTGGGGEPMPPGCCSGAPTASLIPAVAFLLWLRRFTRRS
jgi:hypothetical protein